MENHRKTRKGNNLRKLIIIRKSNTCRESISNEYDFLKCLFLKKKKTSKNKERKKIYFGFNKS